MEIIKWIGFNTIPIGITISIFLLIYGKIRHIKYLDPEVPLGRLLFFLGNIFALGIGFLSVNMVRKQWILKPLLRVLCILFSDIPFVYMVLLSFL